MASISIDEAIQVLTEYRNKMNNGAHLIVESSCYDIGDARHCLTVHIANTLLYKPEVREIAEQKQRAELAAWDNSNIHQD